MLKVLLLALPLHGQSDVIPARNLEQEDVDTEKDDHLLAPKKHEMLGSCVLKQEYFDMLDHIESLLEAGEGAVKEFGWMLPQDWRDYMLYDLQHADEYLHNIKVMGWLPLNWVVCLGCKIVKGRVDHIKWEIWKWLDSKWGPIAGLFGYMTNELDNIFNWLCSDSELALAPQGSPDVEYLRKAGRIEDLNRWQKANGLALSE